MIKRQAVRAPTSRVSRWRVYATQYATQLLGHLLPLGGAILAVLPAPVRMTLIEISSRLTLWLWSQKRHNTEHNYNYIFGGCLTNRQQRWWARRSFRSYARLVSDVLLTTYRGADTQSQRVLLFGQDYLEDVLREGRGLIVVLPHLGAWESALAVVARLPYTVLAVVDSSPLSQALAPGRQRARLRLIPQESAVRPALEALKANHVVVLAADLVKNFSAVDVTFFGKRSALPAGPAFLAYRTGAGIVPIVAYRQDDDRPVIECWPPLWPQRHHPLKIEVERLSQEIAHHFERMVRIHPEQWYPFQPLWS
ncbi:MAG: lysophospholipid acyltransferase family protein [Chloroflexi bacterium]|nr:lysophospholipid acyltransferase family protein [Chloroflexota bacterium]